MRKSGAKSAAGAVVVLFLFSCLASAAPGAPNAGPQKGEWGAGVILGQPSGATVKYWTNQTFAFDGGVGESQGDATLYGDWVLNAWDLMPQPSKDSLGAYFSVGPRLQFDDEAELFLRTMGGLSYWLKGHPAEIFVEVGPVFRLTQGGEVDADGGLGIRFYFTPAGG